MHLGRTGEAFFLGEEVEDGSGETGTPNMPDLQELLPAWSCVHLRSGMGDPDSCSNHALHCAGDIELTEEQLSGMMSPPPGYSSQEDRPPYATAEQVHHHLLRNHCCARATSRPCQIRDCSSQQLPWPANGNGAVLCALRWWQFGRRWRISRASSRRWRRERRSLERWTA